MERWFAVEHLDVERLLAEWRWLCPGRMTLAARNAFADLFLRNESGQVFRLEVGVARLRKVADSEPEFRDLAQTGKNREEWFAEADEKMAAGQGLTPNADQCIGFSVPLVLAGSGTPNPPYIADLYEHVSMLGDVNRQIAHLPDGTNVRLQVKRAPTQ
jgi:hypothetical protein